MEDKRLVVVFDGNSEPQFEFNGAWNIRDLGRTRSTLFRAFKHYMRNIRLKENAELEQNFKESKGVVA